jgi:hypothetical protein
MLRIYFLTLDSSLLTLVRVRYSGWLYKSAAKPKNAAPTAPIPTPCTLRRPPAAGLELELVAAAEAVCEALLAALLRLALTLDAAELMLLRAEEADADADATAPVPVMVLLELAAVLAAVELAVQPAETGCTREKTKH